MVNEADPNLRGALLQIPPILLKLAKLGNCVAFIGAGFSRAAGMPGWGELLEILFRHAAEHGSAIGSAERLQICRDCIDAGDYIVAASELREILHQSDINRIISDQYSDSRLKKLDHRSQSLVSRRLTSLATGPWAGFITTNYDTLIERALDQCPRPTAKVLTPEADLGLILNRTQANELFFVKIHGTINAGKTILTSQEYEEAYLQNSKIQNFLLASMMTYNFLFIGSSIETEILRIRQKLCSDFGGGVPLAFALLPGDKANVRRARWLLNFARIQSIFYSPGSHEALDELLSKFSELEYNLKEHDSSFLPVLPIRNGEEQNVGSVNQSIISYIKQGCSGVITKEQLLRLTTHPQLPEELARISRDEVLYRTLFLVNIGILSQAQIGDSVVYEVTD